MERGGLISVFVVAASRVVRAGLEALVAGDRRFAVTGGAAQAQDAATHGDWPHAVLLVDVERQTREAVEALYPVTDEEGGRAAAVVLLVPDGEENKWAVEALRAGAAAVLARGAAEEEMLAALEAAAYGFAVLSRPTLETLLADAPHFADDEPSPEALTPRETEVLGMLGEGLGNKTIAYRLGISEHTVKFHVAQIFGKLGVASRTEAVTQGLRRGLILL